MCSKNVIVAGVGFWIVAAGGLAVAAPLGREWSYQGQLKLGGVPVNGTADFEFQLWDACAGGNFVANAAPQPSNVSVVNGLFDVTLDFGANAFNGDVRCLAVSVRSPAGGGAFTSLGERQPVDATPYALQTRGIFVEEGGNVGIGDLTPLAKLTVGNGDKFQVSGTDGDVTFTDDQASITFPTADATNAPMIQMFASGISNGDRMVLAHSPGSPAWGLQYRDVGDEFHFLRNGTSVMSVNLGSSSVGIGATAPGRKLQVGDNTVSNSEGMIRLASRSGTQGSNRIWDIGVPETDADSSGPGYSFVIDDISAGSEPEFMVKFGSGNVGIGTTSPAYLLDVNGRMRVREEAGGTAGIWLYQTTPAANRAFVGMYDDDTVGFYGATGASWDLVMDTTSGNVGIKTVNPQAPLHILSSSDAEPGGGGVLVLGSTTSGNLALDGNEIMARNNGATSPLYLNNDGGNIHMAVASGGVSIGTTTIPTGVLLAVDGKVLCEEMEVQLSGDWPDFVFEESYALMPLNELERSIADNGHLPGIPAAAHVAEHGINVGQMQTQTLQKVEELTLYVIELNKQLEVVMRRNDELTARLAAVEGKQ